MSNIKMRVIQMLTIASIFEDSITLVNTKPLNLDN